MLEIIRQRQPEIAAICRRYDVKQLELFGSAAREEDYDAVGDFDFAVSFRQLDAKNPVGQLFGLQNDLSDLLGKPVDLVELTAVRNPYVLRTINEDKKLVFPA
jgi:uncharacterized protein